MEKINKLEKKLLNKVEKATNQVFKEDDFENTGNPGESHNNNICCQGCYRLGIVEGKRQEKDIKADHLAGHYRAGIEEGKALEQKRIIEMFRSLYEKKKIALKNLGLPLELPLEDWWGESEIFSVNELEDLKQQIQEEKKQ